MDDARRGAAKVLATMTETIRQELQTGPIAAADRRTGSRSETGTAQPCFWTRLLVALGLPITAARRRAMGRLRPYQMIVAKKAEPAMMSVTPARSIAVSNHPEGGFRAGSWRSAGPRRNDRRKGLSSVHATKAARPAHGCGQILRQGYESLFCRVQPDQAGCNRGSAGAAFACVCDRAEAAPDQRGERIVGRA